MRRIAWILLIFFAFAVPWEYSLDLGEPLGNVARVLGLLLLLAAVPAVLDAGRLADSRRISVDGAGFLSLVLLLFLLDHRRYRDS